MKARTSAVVVLVVTFFWFAPAQTYAQTGTDRVVVTTGKPLQDALGIIRRFPRDQAEIFTAPAKLPTSRHALAYVAPLIAAAAFIPLDRHIVSHPQTAHGGTSATISDLGLYGTAGAVGATYIYGWARDDEHARQTGILGAEAFANTILPHIAMNLVFGRQRPYEGTGESFGEGEFFANHKTGSSFPSGHCLYTWSMASVLASEYPSAPNQILWYGVGTTVAITRVTAREHWVSDVIVGSAIGYLIGRHIWRVHSRHIE